MLRNGTSRFFPSAVVLLALSGAGCDVASDPAEEDRVLEEEQAPTWTAYWDARHGHGLAVPSHWLIRPTPLDGWGGALVLRNYELPPADFRLSDALLPEGAAKLYFTSYDIEPGISTVDWITQNMSNELSFVASTEETTIGSHAAILATVRLVEDPAETNSLLGFRIAPEKILIVIVKPEPSWDLPDVQSISNSLAFSRRESLDMPSGRPAPLLDSDQFDIPSAELPSATCGEEYISPESPLGLVLPFEEGSEWTVGGAGSFYGEGNHTGNDFYATDWNCCGYGAADLGEPVYPIAPGRVIDRKAWNGSTGYGNIVYVQHAGVPPFRTGYAHLNEITVDLGDVAFTTTPIGTVGESGTGSAHLHLRFQRRDEAGQRWLSRQNDPLSRKPSPMWTADGSKTLCSSATLTATKTASVFRDVNPNRSTSGYIESLYAHGYTAGCNSEPLLFCPYNNVTRAEMAVFIVRAYHGPEFEPPQPAVSLFYDVPLDAWYATWVHQLYNDGFTAGCSTDPPLYCPENLLTTVEIAVFMLRAKHGTDYTPPPAQGIFADTKGHWGERWAEVAYNEGIIGECGVYPLRFCPDSTVTRETMALYMVLGFALALP